jgi:flavin-dependent dehydrogenase
MVVSDTSEVLVLGAGPAGAAAARLLALWGHQVRLIARPDAATDTGLAESLTPSCGKVFDLLGIRDRIDAAPFVHGRGNTVWWGGGEARLEPFAEGTHGWQATTTALERVLLDAVLDAGVTVERRTLTAEDAAQVPAAFRLDGTGRAGVLARARAGRQYEPGHRTVALSSTWSRDGWPLPDITHTLIESYADGWAWSVPLDATRRAVAVMIDPRTTGLRKGQGARAVYLGELAKTTRFRHWLEEAQLDHDPVGWDASMYASRSYVGDDWLVMGDAASFVDPLSSAGVKKALASGWLAAITTHTILTRPGMAEAARAFYAAREAEVYAGYLALTRQYLGEGAAGRAHPFWSERADAAERDARVAGERDARAAVRAAHDAIRAGEALRLRPNALVTVEPRPAIAGREIVLESRLALGPADPGVRFLHDVDVVVLVELAPAFRQVPDLYDAYVRRAGPTDLAGFLTALATVVGRGWLVSDDTHARTIGSPAAELW